MKNSFTQRVVLGILALFLLSYVGIQIFRYTNSHYKTETANIYTVADSTRVNGVVLRNEILLEDSISGGVATYVSEDGSKVSPGMTIAEVYDSESDISNIRTLRALSNQRELLEKAQDPGTTSFAHTDVLNKQIFSELGGIIDAVNGELLPDLKNRSDKLLVLMNTKQIATGRQQDFSATIEKIQAEEEYYSRLIDQEPRKITAPQPGYFIRTIDGFENRVVPTAPELEEGQQPDPDLVALDALDELRPEQLKKLMARPAAAPAKRAGKLMTSHIWYYAVSVPANQAGKFREGATVTLDFGASGMTPVAATIKHVNTSREEPDAVIVFESDYISEGIVNLRLTQAEVRFKTISGLRVSEKAIRFNGTQKGVYILLGEKLVFRPITVIHEDQGFVLCWETDPDYLKDNSYTGLQRFDEVVIGGTGIYDTWLL